MVDTRPSVSTALQHKAATAQGGLSPATAARCWSQLVVHRGFPAVAVTAVGSLQMQYQPGEMALVNQFIDRTKTRQDTFFGDGIVSHV